MTNVSHQREKTIKILEKELDNLSKRENELKEKIETLEKVPIPALEHFTEILSKGERREWMRDTLFFILGAVTSIVVSILLSRWGIVS